MVADIVAGRWPRRAMAVMREMVEEGIDVMKVSNDDYRRRAGGRRLPSCCRHELAGTATVREARALGLRERHRFGHLEGERHLRGARRLRRDAARRGARAAARAAAIEAAVEAGAVRETVEIIDSEDVPLAVLPRSHQPREGEGCGRFERSSLSRKPLKAKAPSLREGRRLFRAAQTRGT